MGSALRALCLGLICALLAQSLPVLAGDGAVHAVLFYSPSCPHCHQVINEELPPLLEEYGEQFSVIAVNTAHPDGQELYQATIERFNVPPERRGVPTLIIGENVLVGSLEIPQQLPLLIDIYLAQGGVGWPDIPGLAEALNSGESTPEPSSTAAAVRDGTATPGATVAASPTPPEEAAPGAAQPGSPQGGGQIRDLTGDAADGVYARFRQDALGNSLSLLVLMGMIGATLNVSMRFRKLSGSAVQRSARARWMYWTTLGLVLLGLGVSLYMAYVETSHATAVCGPVGDCNTVQQSEYAWLFGVLPIGVIGVVGYAALGLTWAVGHLYHGRRAQWARLALFLMALVGTLFSIYLTFLEPFVIGATCLWCLSSAVTITLILVLTVGEGQKALAELIAVRPRRQWQRSQF